MKIDNLSHSNQTFENMYISHPQMQAIILFKNLDFFLTKSQNDAWQPPKPLKLNIFEFIYRGCQLLTRKCHRTKFFARLAARLIRQFAHGSPLASEKCNVIVSAFLRKTFTLREIQSLTGLLNFACSVLVPGRAFFASLDRFDEGNEICLSFCPSSKSVKADLEIWRFLLDDFNGRSIFFAMYGLIRLV